MEKIWKKFLLTEISIIYIYLSTTAGADSISSVARKLKRNTLLIGSEYFLLVDDSCNNKRSSGENEEENDDEVEATEDLEN